MYTRYRLNIKLYMYWHFRNIMWETDQSAGCSSSGSQPTLSDCQVLSSEGTGGLDQVRGRTRSAEDLRWVAGAEKFCNN